MLRLAASRVRPLGPRLREGAHYFQEGPTCYRVLVNDTTPLGIACPREGVGMGVVEYPSSMGVTLSSSREGGIPLYILG